MNADVLLQKFCDHFVLPDDLGFQVPDLAVLGPFPFALARRPLEGPLGDFEHLLDPQGIWLGWTLNSSACLETSSLPLKCRLTIAAFCSAVKCLRPLLMERTSGWECTNPNGQPF